MVKRYPRSFFRYSLVVILFITCMPGLLIGLGIYGTVIGKMETVLQRMHQNQISQRAANVDEQLAHLELTFSHWAFEPMFDNRLQQIDFVNGYKQVQELYRTLLVVNSTHALIDRTELFLDKPEPLTIAEDGYALLSDSLTVGKYERLLSQRNSIFWTDAYPAAKGRGAGDTITLVNRVPAGSREPFGMLAVSVKKVELASLLQTLTPYDEGSAFLLTEGGNWLVTSDGRGNPSSLDSALREAYLEHGGKPGAFLFEHEGKTYSVLSGELRRLGTTWVYISAAPLTTVVAPVLFASRLAMGICGGGLLLSLLLSWFGSRRLYSPVKRLLGALEGAKSGGWYGGGNEFEAIELQWNKMASESATLRNRLEEQLPLVRESFLIQLAQGHFLSMSEQRIRERFEQLGWELTGTRFAVMMLQLRKAAGASAASSSQDEEMLTFAAAHLAKETLVYEGAQIEALNFHELSVGLLFMLPGDEDETQTRLELRRVGHDWIAEINRALQLRVILSVSRTVCEADRIPLLFEEARQALGMRSLTEINPLIDLEQLDKSDIQRDFQYPFAMEKDIIYAIRSGLPDEAMNAIEGFVGELSARGATEGIVQQAMLQLLASIQHCLLQAGLNPVRLFEEVNLLGELQAIKDTDEMLEWFRSHVVGVFISEFAGWKDNQLRETVDKLAVYLQKHYMTAVSLDELAERMGMSSYSLSRAFKEVLGVNYIDYVTRLRLDRAKELLADSDMKINGIAESVGYQSSYFNRIFKKYEGVTPSHYRNIKRGLPGRLLIHQQEAGDAGRGNGAH